MSQSVIFCTMQKDEKFLLILWLRYYANLVGKQNIIVFDNGSTDGITLEILKCAQTCGFKINYNHNTYNDFLEKGNVLLSQTKLLYPDVDIIVPNDIDEFLIALSPEVSFNYSLIRKNLFKNIFVNNFKSALIRINKGYYNIPYTFETSVFNCKRLIVKSKYDGVLDRGFHFYGFSSDKDLPAVPMVVSPDLGYFHFHYRPFKDMCRRSKDKLAGLTDVEDMGALKNYRGQGNHLIPDLLISEKEYLQRLKEKVIQSTLDVKILWKETGLPYPFLTTEENLNEFLNTLD